ncbi:MAG: long-chain fatty acid--CoA ligase [Verrucomicrobia bacterium]|nr:long-chain fatty acid--CoA ligase [Verrucomicrobiota bacterium]
MNLAIEFDHSAQRCPDSAALFWGEQEFTYSDIRASASRLAAYWSRELGIRPGDRVAVWLRNSPEFVLCFKAALRLGAVLVPINNFLKEEETQHILEDSGARLLICDSSTLEHALNIQSRLRSLKIWNTAEMASVPEGSSDPDATRSVRDLAVIIYTSGTTGRSKGAMLTHGNLLSNIGSCRQVLMAVDSDRFVVLLPLFHSFMLTVGMLLPLMVGGSIVLIRSLHPAKNIFQEIMLRGGTILPAIPQFFRTLAAAGVPAGFPVRLCISGAAPLPGEILREFNEKIPDVPLLEGYGLSEASPVVSINPIRGPWKQGSIGVPIPDVEVSVQDDSGTLLGVGQTGEICVKGPNVMQGYWNQPDETRKALVNGWLRTGDVGHRDADGYFYITDRKKDMLLVNGINVYPREIEEVIYQYPGVKEAAVIGTADARRGEMPVAFVVASEGGSIDEKGMVAFLRERLADYKVPKRVVHMAALPRNATGKVLKRELRQASM